MRTAGLVLVALLGGTSTFNLWLALFAPYRNWEERLFRMLVAIWLLLAAAIIQSTTT